MEYTVCGRIVMITDYFSAELFVSAVIVLLTGSVILFVRSALRRGERRDRLPECRVVLYYHKDCERFERIAQKVVQAPCFKDTRVSFRIVDKENSEESRRWLLELSKKLEGMVSLERGDGS